MTCCGSTLYVGGGSTGKVETSRTVYRYCTINDIWSSLPICPYYTFALAVVKGCVTGSFIAYFLVELYVSDMLITLVCKSLCDDFPPLMIYIG